MSGEYELKLDDKDLVSFLKENTRKNVDNFIAREWPSIKDTCIKASKEGASFASNFWFPTPISNEIEGIKIFLQDKGFSEVKITNRGWMVSWKGKP